MRQYIKIVLMYIIISMTIYDVCIIIDLKTLNIQVHFSCIYNFLNTVFRQHILSIDNKLKTNTQNDSIFNKVLIMYTLNT